jgi:hypothetical protein
MSLASSGCAKAANRAMPRTNRRVFDVMLEVVLMVSEAFRAVNVSEILGSSQILNKDVLRK